jgi:hypothetical protein
MKIAKKIYTVLCDDIREEARNKISLLGMYSGGDIIFEDLPAVLPKICLAICLEELKVNISKIEIKLILPKMDPISFSALPPPHLKIGMNANLGFGFAPFKVDTTGDAKVEIRFGEEKRPSIVHKFKIKSKK